MRIRSLWVGAVLTLFAMTGRAVQAEPSADEAVRGLVKSFMAAEEAYDPAALRKLISPAYVEVSPAGEVDAYDRFLGFYTPDKKVPFPPMQVSEEQVRVFGDTAVEILKLSWTMPGPDGTTRSLDIRETYVAHREDGVWKLISAQFTGIRPVPAQK